MQAQVAVPFTWLAPLWVPGVVNDLYIGCVLQRTSKKAGGWVASIDRDKKWKTLCICLVFAPVPAQVAGQREQSSYIPPCRHSTGHPTCLSTVIRHFAR